MSQTLTLTTQQLPEQVGTLSAGDRVLLSGTIYTARDAAHKRLFQLLDEGRPLPFHLQGAVIYYAGPTPGQQGTQSAGDRCHHAQQGVLLCRRGRRGGSHRQMYPDLRGHRL